MATKASRGNLEFAVLLAVVSLACFALTDSALFLVGILASVAWMGSGTTLDRRQQWLVLGLALVYFMVVFGYSMGKDLAKRDNAAAALTTQSAAAVD